MEEIIMIIKTGIKADSKFMTILHACIGQMSDGIWENTRSMEKYWKSLSINEDSSGMIEIDDRYFVCSSPADFMANKIKQIIKIEIDDGNTKLEWSRTCSAVPQYITYGSPITVGDCYELYELLKGRDTSKKCYSSYRTYEVELAYGADTFKFTVEALNESQAKRQAIQNMVSLISAKKVTQI
jgi:hypothetical protein